MLTRPFRTTADITDTDEEFVFGGKHGFGIFDKKSKSYKYVKRVWGQDEVDAGHEIRLRGNDGAVDSRGRYWLGMMTDPSVDAEFKPEGVLFRLDSDLSLHRMLEGVTIPNGITWSQDNKTMYFTDSPTKTIDAFDFDEESGSITNRRAFFTYTGTGVPDGHCMSRDGDFWIAICGGGKVLQVSPEGEVIAEVLLPTLMPTCPAFCGEDLMITSAEEEEPEKHPESARYSGSIFKFHAGVQGQRLYRFRFLGGL